MMYQKFYCILVSDSTMDGQTKLWIVEIVVAALNLVPSQLQLINFLDISCNIFTIRKGTILLNSEAHLSTSPARFPAISTLMMISRFIVTNS